VDGLRLSINLHYDPGKSDSSDERTSATPAIGGSTTRTSAKNHEAVDHFTAEDENATSPSTDMSKLYVDQALAAARILLPLFSCVYHVRLVSHREIHIVCLLPHFDVANISG
jgi:hypothetical protein